MSKTEDKNRETKVLFLRDSGVYCKVCLHNHRYFTLKLRFETNTYIFSTKMLNGNFDRELKMRFISFICMSLCRLH
jgi:hypothetical protein